MRSAMRLRAASSKLPALLALLGALLPGLGEAELSVYPTEATVLRGSSLLVNCSDSCEDVGLETPITKEKVSEGDTWKTFLRSGVQEDSEPLCFSNCGQQDMLLLPITVYWSPESIELAPLPPWQPVGENLTLSCQIKGGAPRSNLTAVLLRGDEVLSRQPVPGDPTKLVEVMAEVPVRREDHGANFSCRTELDLRSRGLELFENSSAPLQLRTFVSTCSCNCQMRSSTWARSCRPSSSSFCDSMCSRSPRITHLDLVHGASALQGARPELLPPAAPEPAHGQAAPHPHGQPASHSDHAGDTHLSQLPGLDRMQRGQGALPHLEQMYWTLCPPS